MLGQLPDNLADSPARARDEDCLPLLRLPDRVEGRVGCQAGHAQRAEIEFRVEVVRVIEFAQLAVGEGLGRDARVLLCGQHAGDDIAGLEFRGGGFEDLGHGGVGDGFIEGEGRGVGFYFRGAHAAALVGVEGDVEVFGGEAALGGFGIL